MNTPRHPPFQHRASLRRQSGIALVVALILLVIMTLVGLSAMRTVTLEEKMAAQTFDRSLSFQAAEAALREAEAVVEATVPTPAALAGCVAGICGSPNSSALERWADSSFTGWQNAAAVSNGPISITPQYIVEYLGATFPCMPGSPAAGTDCKRYRITARSNAGNDRAVVTLQSIFAAE
ncbi:PilX N-terminal domain-containing pilus assembly protein [Hydrogenophaga sp.]|uniref:pilus assembly PilX family protein n=1 Tax=Hydrogenophaga sp. TaxID=1904254 RepID=UPI00271CEDE4|nr:PilX N-terminal domain-containing pilus assembly protein [Hydrogenophaga sp.]MDO9434346.1 PilX N-terminal domain-containing pilus assembly protein [Hydrogenophaga sp.]